MPNGHECMGMNANHGGTIIGKIPKNFGVIAWEQQSRLPAVSGGGAHQQDK